MNKVHLIGRLTRDPELQYTQSNTEKLRFTIAINRRRASKGQEPEADFVDCVAWRATAKFISQYFAKGQAIVVSGELRTHNWEDERGSKHKTTEVRVDEVEFGETKKAREASGQNTSLSGNAELWSQPHADFEELPDDDGEVPF